MKKKKRLKVKYALNVDILYSGTWRPGSLVDEHGRSYFPIGHFKNVNHETNIGWILEIPNEIFEDFPTVRKAQLLFRSDMTGIYDPAKDPKSPLLTVHLRPACERSTYKYRKSSFCDDIASVQVSTKDTATQKSFVDITDSYNQGEFWVIVCGKSHIYLHPQLHLKCSKWKGRMAHVIN